MNQCSAEYPYGVDEMMKVGLTPLASAAVQPLRVKEAAVQMECELYGQLEVGDGSVGSSTVIIGKILLIHVAREVYDEGRIRLDRLQPIARLAGSTYGRTTDTFDLPRPQL